MKGNDNMAKTYYTPHFEFFYLNENISSHKGYGLRLKTLGRDIERGVRRLSEWAYNPNWGSTRSSMRFLNALIDAGIDIQNAYRAELRHNQKDWYTLFVYTIDGYTLMFKGVSGGYYGEGTRGCYDILKACGFNEKQCQKVWHNESFKVVKKSV